MPTYDLYLESGPKKRKTMVHVLDLLGCVATGPTTDEALAATPTAIDRFRRFLHRHGDPIDPDTPIETRIAEHVTEGMWLGNGSPYIDFSPDLQPLTDAETETFLQRLAWITEAMATWSERQPDADLDAKPEDGRSQRGILLHVLGAQGSYLSAALGGAKGFGAIHGQAERGELPLPEALRQSTELFAGIVQGTNAEQRGAIRELSSRHYTLRKAMRRALEHGWEHLAELSRRPGGPSL